MEFRLLNKIYAFIMGYFWLPCPNCGKMFGGHESGHKSILKNGNLFTVCPDCQNNPNVKDGAILQHQQWYNSMLKQLENKGEL